MRLQNVKRLLIFAPNPNGSDPTLEQIRAKFGIDPDGTNFYYGINQTNVDDSSGLPSALNPTHRAFLDALLASTITSSSDEKTLVLGVEPPSKKGEPGFDKPYAFVAANTDLVERLATDLAAYQQRARKASKRLNIIIRYASEMNDGSQAQGHDPAGFKSTFAQVRKIFSRNAHDAHFSFSPALRADIVEDSIAHYWPGDEHVDIIGGTWYIAKPEQRTLSIACLRSYFLQRKDAGKPFGLDELGGCDAKGTHNDPVIQDMLHEIEQLELKKVSFLYATIFLGCKYGKDATLGFLRPK
jgi:hypothetical protein